MKLKRTIAMLATTISIIGLFAGCKNPSKTSKENMDTAKTVTENNKGSQDIKEITWMYAQMSGMIPADLEKVQDAVNEITEEEIGVRVKLSPVAFSDYANQISLVMASQEKVDIITTAGSKIWSTLLNQKQLSPLNDLLDDYGGKIKDIVPEEFFPGTTVNGNIYGITTNSSKGSTWGIQMRKDLIDKYDLQDEISKLVLKDDIKDMDENFAILENIFQIIKEKEPEMEILFPWATDIAVSFDALSDNMGVMLRDGDNIENLYATDSYKKLCETIYDWAQKGYIMKDAATTTESVGSLMRSGRLFAFTINTGRDNFIEAGNGYESYSINLKSPIIDNGEIVKFANCIPLTSTEPEAAMKFLELLYTDERLVNLMAFGLEGEHYVINEDKTIAYPEGIDASNSAYPGDQPYMYGNFMISAIHETHSAQTHEKEQEFNDKATPMSCLGFSYNSADIKNEVAACSSVVKEYADGLTRGALNPETELPAFIEKLEKSGLNDIIAEKQKQFEEWKKTSSAME